MIATDEITDDLVKALAGMIIVATMNGAYNDQETLEWAARQLNGDEKVVVEHIHKVMKAFP